VYYFADQFIYTSAQRRRGLKKIGGAGSCNFPTDICKFPKEEIMGAENFNFAFKFPQNGGF